MLLKQLTGLMATIASAQAYSKGFNSGNVLTNGQPKVESDFAAEFKRAQNLPGTSGWGSFRLYTGIQAGTSATPISAYQAAIDTGTNLLLGLWASAGQEAFNNEITALQSAISQYGSKFTDLVVGISVGSEDLYRDSVVGQENNAGVGAGPETIVSYISQLKKALQGTALSGASVGHVDTWPAWANSSNSAVAQAVEWAGMDAYPYFQYQDANSISNAKSLFFSALSTTQNAVGKEVWITETGWPVSGKTEGQAVPSIANAETYWQEVSCEIQGKYNVFWYTLQDAEPNIPNPSFGIIGPDLNSAPYYDLSCNSSSSSSSASSSATKSSTKQAATSASTTDLTSYSASATASAASLSASSATAPYIAGAGNGTASIGPGASGVGGGPGPTLGALSTGYATATNSAGVSEQTGNSAAKIGSAMGAGLLAAFGMAAAL